MTDGKQAPTIDRALSSHGSIAMLAADDSNVITAPKRDVLRVLAADPTNAMTVETAAAWPSLGAFFDLTRKPKNPFIATNRMLKITVPRGACVYSSLTNRDFDATLVGGIGPDTWPFSTRTMGTAPTNAVSSAPTGALPDVQAKRRQHLREQLASRREAMIRWDDEDGDRPSDGAFDDADAFVALFPAEGQPSIFVSGDAEVGFSWMQQDGFVEVAFRGDGNIRYAIRSGSGVVGDVTSFSVAGTSTIPLPLKTALKRL